MPTMGAVGDDYVNVIPFCVPLPSSSSFLPTVLAETNSSNIGNGSPVETGFGIVGTITLRGRSAVVWFGWGEIETVVDGGDDECDFLAKDANGISSVGNGKPPMGPLALSMPPVIQNGRPSSLVGVSTTQLLGGSSEEDMILGHHISARLAKRIGCPVFLSCSLSGWGGDSGGSVAAGGGGGGGGQGVASDMSSPALSAGYDDSLQQHAAALAEREVSRILLREIQT